MHKIECDILLNYVENMENEMFTNQELIDIIKMGAGNTSKAADELLKQRLENQTTKVNISMKMPELNTSNNPNIAFSKEDMLQFVIFAINENSFTRENALDEFDSYIIDKIKNDIYK